ncbi:MAG: hypothetical protein AAFP88_01135 [Bacteroidota bacterium]
MKNLNTFLAKHMLAFTVGLVVSCNNSRQGSTKKVLALREQIEALLDDPAKVAPWATALRATVSKKYADLDKRYTVPFTFRVGLALDCAINLIETNQKLDIEDDIQLKRFMREAASCLYNCWGAVRLVHNRAKMDLSEADVERACREIAKLTHDVVHAEVPPWLGDTFRVAEEHTKRADTRLNIENLRWHIPMLGDLVQTVAGRIACEEKVPHFYEYSKVVANVKKEYPKVAPIVEEALSTWEELVSVKPAKPGYKSRLLIKNDTKGRKKFVHMATKTAVLLIEALKELYQNPKFRARLVEHNASWLGK